MEGFLIAFIFWGGVWGFIGAWVAEGRGNNGGLILGFLLGPIGVLIAALTPRSTEAEARREIEVEDEKVRRRREIERHKQLLRGQSGEWQRDQRRFEIWRAENPDRGS